jgi:hypothetical protein
MPNYYPGSSCRDKCAKKESAHVWWTEEAVDLLKSIKISYISNFSVSTSLSLISGRRARCYWRGTGKANKIEIDILFRFFPGAFFWNLCGETLLYRPLGAALEEMKQNKIAGKLYAQDKRRNPPVKPKFPPAITVSSPTFSPKRLMGS